jgi:hypothetical protein
MRAVVAEASRSKKKLDEWAIQVTPEALESGPPFAET